MRRFITVLSVAAFLLSAGFVKAEEKVADAKPAAAAAAPAKEKAAKPAKAKKGKKAKGAAGSK